MVCWSDFGFEIHEGGPNKKATKTKHTNLTQEVVLFECYIFCFFRPPSLCVLFYNLSKHGTPLSTNPTQADRQLISFLSRYV